MGKPIPTVEMTGPAGKVIVNALDAEEYRRKGYVPVGEEAAPDPVLEDEPEEAERLADPEE